MILSYAIMEEVIFVTKLFSSRRVQQLYMNCAISTSAVFNEDNFVFLNI